MKATLAVAALAAGASAGSVHHRHLHGHAKKGYEAEETCGCTTIYSTYYGEATLIFPPAPSPEPTTVSTTQVVVPTPVAQTCPTTGVYTFPATTITLTDATTVAVPSTTSVPAGTHTLGGVTTVVTTATTVVCPYATVSTSEGVVTSVIETTSYVCPSAGTYTIAPTTTTVTEDTTVTLPSVTSYPAGTYTQPEVVTTVYETSTVVYCPFDIPTPSTSEAAQTTYVAETTPVETPVSVSTPVEVPETTATYPVEVTTYPVTTKAEPSTTSTKTPKPTSSSPGKTPPKGTAGKPWAVTYTPYQTSAGGGCKSQGEVNSDIAAIAAAGVTTIRVYSTDCSTLEFVGGACEANGIKMILGIYVDEPGCDAANPSVTEQISSIQSWGKWDLVSLITVGNEAVLHGYCTPSELAGLISTTKETLSYTGPYSTAETVNIWQQEEFSSLVCPVVDFVGANAHAFFNTETTASQAGQFVKGQLDIIDNICSGKEGRVMETGWPNAGQVLGLAVPGVSQQATAIKSIVQELGDKAVIFSLTSDAWKDGNTQCQCEQHWGCASVLGISM
ncbi:glycoside hydrolase family 17 protein [Xylaria arbuscula]|nr:glycoside hydrolase family 17 protein [Xylaria arbuscula]